MRVKIGNYVNRWISNLHQEYMEKKYDGNLYDSVDQIDHYVEAVDDMMQWLYDHSINLYLDRKKQKVDIRIDRFDTWSMDDTLAPIILPMLKQLKTTQHGAGFVELSDVPKELHGKKLTKEQGAKGEVDDKHFERWDYVLDEMIWAFEQKCRDDWNDDYIDSEDDPDSFMGTKFTRWDDKGMKAHQKRMTNGFRLFGTYFENLWD
jgi:hypothetical protein